MEHLLSAVLFSLAVALSAGGNVCFADGSSASDELSAAAHNGDDASHATSDESARAGAGAGFDSAGSSEPPPVDLSGCGEHCTVDPAVLKKDDPPPVSLQPSYVPPLPPSE